MKNLRAIILFVLVMGIIIYFRNDLPLVRKNIEAFFKQANIATSTNSILTDLKKEISTPPPLRQSGGASLVSGDLTSNGVIKQTNQNREENGLGDLSLNAKLTAAAEEKLNDMFKNQYFEHVSPSGRGPADLANDVSYQYIVIGENLALGNFGGDKALVNAWMASPGHRANILNVKYKEIGVAVGKGQFNGETTWLAVQEFGEPLSECPSPDASLQGTINTMEGAVSSLNDDLKTKKAVLDATSPSDPSYNQKADIYNAEVKQYNGEIGQIKVQIDQYNTEVKIFNTCAGNN